MKNGIFFWGVGILLLPCLMQAAAPLKQTGLVTRASSEDADVQRITSSSLAVLTEPNRDGFAPLHRAAYHCKPKAIDALVQAGVDVNDGTSCGRLCWIWQSALGRAITMHVHFFEGVKPNLPATISTLIGHGANLNEERQLSMFECEKYELGSRTTTREYLRCVSHEHYNLKQCLIEGLQKRKQTHAAIASALPSQTMLKDLTAMICQYVVLFEPEDEAVLAGELS